MTLTSFCCHAIGNLSGGNDGGPRGTGLDIGIGIRDGGMCDVDGSM